MSKADKMFEEVLHAWKNVNEDVLIDSSTSVNEGYRIVFPNEMYFEINEEQVYSNKKVFSMNVDQTLKAINLTIEYLKMKELGWLDENI